MCSVGEDPVTSLGTPAAKMINQSAEKQLTESDYRANSVKHTKKTKN